MLRTIIWYIAVAGTFVLTLPLWLVAKLSPAKDKRHFVAKEIAIMKPIVLGTSGVTLSVEGGENMPDKPALYIANHQGLFDIVITLGGLGKPLAFLAKKESETVPIASSWMKMLGCVFIDRNNPRESLKAIQECEERLKDGYSMIIFPEGTRSRKHEMGEFKSGSMRCAIKAGVPIVPCVIDGSYKAWEEYHRIRPCEIKIRVLPPVETKGLEKERTKHIADEVEQMIREALG